MYVDTQSEFSDAQAVTATAISSNVMDLFAASGAGTALTAESTIDFGQGVPVYLVVQAVTAAAGGDAAKTLTITLESDSTANLATSATVHASTTAITGAAITAGARLLTLALPSDNYERYLGLRYTVSASFTSFTIDAFLTVDPAAVRRVYKTGFVVQ